MRETPAALVQSNGVTVWVNGPAAWAASAETASTSTGLPALSSNSASVSFCTHAPTTEADWETFKTKMNELYGVTVSDKHRPDRFKRRRNANQ